MINVEFKDEINDLSTENLYQWDSYQTLNIKGINFSGITPKVHFANKKSTEALVVQGVLQDDGSVNVSIPNSLLMEKYDIIGYVYINTGITSKTIKSITIPIIPRLKPTEYIQITDENIAEIEAIELQAKVILEGLTASEYSPTVTYKRPNIVYHQLSSYMCISNDEITGIEPTDTTKWQKLANGINITGISVNESGNLVFINQDGSTYEVAFSTSEVKAVDEMEVPCLRLTSEDVDKVKTPYITYDFKNKVFYPSDDGDFDFDVVGLKVPDGYIATSASFTAVCHKVGDTKSIEFRIRSNENLNFHVYNTFNWAQTIYARTMGDFLSAQVKYDSRVLHFECDGRLYGNEFDWSNGLDNCTHLYTEFIIDSIKNLRIYLEREHTVIDCSAYDVINF